MTLQSFLLVVMIAAATTGDAVAVGAWGNHQATVSVLGQAGLASTGAIPSDSGISQPVGVAIDPTTGKVSVGRGGNRILRFASQAALTNGAIADAPFGQKRFHAAVSA